MAKTRSIPIVLLRFLATAACFSAAIVMVTSHQTVTVFGIIVDAKYQYTPAFKFLAIVNGIISAYSLLVLFIPSTSSLNRVVIFTDVLVAMFLTASLSASGSIAYVGKKGNAHSGWMPVCDQIPKFCNQAGGALVCNFVAVVVYTVIALYSIHAALRSLYL